MMSHYTKIMNDDRLKILKCHFTWNLEDISKETILQKLIDKNKDSGEEEWINVLLLLTIAYELYCMKKTDEAENKLKECLVLFEVSEDEFLNSYIQAFEHVIYSVKACMDFIDGVPNNEIDKIISRIPVYENFSAEQKTAITGIQAYVIGNYNEDGRKRALELEKQALKENPNEPQWYLMVGISLLRIRGFKNDKMVTKNEMDCFEKAYTMKKSTVHKLYLAQLYLDASVTVRHHHIFKEEYLDKKKSSEKIQELVSRSKELFNEVLEENYRGGGSINSIIRCAKGLFKLNTEDKDNCLKMLKIINQCLEKAPNNITAHGTASSICLTLGRDYYDLAYEHDKKCDEDDVYSGTMRVIEKKIRDNILNPEKEFEELLKRYPHIDRLRQTHLYATCYYLYQIKNLRLALNHCLEFSKLPDTKLEDYVHYVYLIQKKVNLCEELYSEIKRFTNEPKSTELIEDIKILEDKYPDLKRKN